MRLRLSQHSSASVLTAKPRQGGGRHDESKALTAVLQDFLPGDSAANATNRFCVCVCVTEKVLNKLAFPQEEFMLHWRWCSRPICGHFARTFWFVKFLSRGPCKENVATTLRTCGCWLRNWQLGKCSIHVRDFVSVCVYTHACVCVCMCLRVRFTTTCGYWLGNR